MKNIISCNNYTFGKPYNDSIHRLPKFLVILVSIYFKLILSTAICISTVYGSTTSINETLKQAAAFESSNNPGEALKIYRSLYNRHPRRTDILFRLESLLSQTGHYDKIVDLLETRLRIAPKDFTALLRMGDAFYALGKRETAYKYWNRVTEGTSRSNLYLLVASHYRKRNLISQAKTLYHGGRRALKNPTLFAKELAELAEQQADYTEAVKEYLILLQDKPQYRPFIESRLQEFAQEANPKAPIFSLLADQVRKNPKNLDVSRLLVEYALPAGYAVSAIQVLVNQTNKLHENNSSLLKIASYCLGKQVFSTAAAAYEILIDQTTNSSNLRSRALLGLARSKEGLTRADEANRIYLDLIQHYPHHPEADEAHYRLGLLMQETDHQAALQIFQNLVGNGRRSLWHYLAFFQISELYLQTNQFPQAEAACNIVSIERLGHEEADEASYRIAELRFFSGDFDSAQILLETLISGPIHRYFVNDAISLLTLIQKANKENPELLKTYALAKKQERQGNTEAALTTLKNLSRKYSNSGFSDQILVARTKLQKNLKHFQQAIQTCRQLITDIPRSPFSPWAHMTLGEIYEDHLKQFLDARKAYEALLDNYPESLEANSARARLRTIQKKIQDS